MSYETVSVSGPIFDGRAQAASDAWTRDSEKQLAQDTQQRIRSRARTYDRSGRGGTGVAAAHVSAGGRGGSYVVTGNSNKGQVWWPWLEGTSRRNQTTRFKGYHDFRKAAAAAQQRAGRLADGESHKYVAEMND